LHCKERKSMENNIKSRHVFLYAFLIKPPVEGRKKQKDWFQKEYLNNSRHWQPWELSKDADFLSQADDYMVGQYFNKEARALFMQSDDKECRRYTYDKEVLRDTDYIIVCGGKEYHLPLEEVELFIFHDRVGVLKLQAANTAYEKIADIKIINDMGRRLSMPFLPRKGDSFDKGEYILCADKLGLKRRSGEACIIDFREYAEGWEEITPQLSLYEKAPLFIYALLAGEFGSQQGTYPKASELRKGEQLQSLIDDRMYLCSLIKDDNLSSVVNNEFENKEKKIVDNEEYEKTLYSLAFADNGAATCQNKQMRNALLKKAFYMRWSDLGTLYSVTNSAFLCITANDPDGEKNLPNSVYRPFIKEYVLIAILVLAQKLSITDFSERAAQSAGGAGKAGRLSDRQIDDITELHESYVDWSNKEYLLEVTEQEQGVDIYKLLREQLSVDVHMKKLREQLQDLYAVANVNQGIKLNHLAGLLAVTAILTDIVVNLRNFFINEGDKLTSDCYTGIMLVLFSVIIVCSICLFRRKIRKEKCVSR